MKTLADRLIAIDKQFEEMEKRIAANDAMYHITSLKIDHLNKKVHDLNRQIFFMESK